MTRRERRMFLSMMVVNDGWIRIRTPSDSIWQTLLWPFPLLQTPRIGVLSKEGHWPDATATHVLILEHAWGPFALTSILRTTELDMLYLSKRDSYWRREALAGVLVT